MNTEFDLQTWPEEVFTRSGISAWIASALSLPESVTITPLALYAVYKEAPDLRLTARFAVIDTSGIRRDVVFKENRFPLLEASARIHSLVSRHCPGMVPHVLAAQDNSDGSSYLLYQLFEGSAVSDAAQLIQTARTMAYIQNAVAASGECEGVTPLRVRAQDIPSLFETVYTHIDAHQSAWRTDTEGKLSKALGSSAADVLTLLDSARMQVYPWADEIAALQLPDTIDHGDLHGGNAIVQEEGVVLIHDWETATIGCPLFSLEKLLVAAWKVDTNSTAGGPWGYRAGTPTQALVRDGYLDALGLRGVGDQTFARAMCLATIKEMHAEIVWANLTGWPDGNPEWTAQLLNRFQQHLGQAK